ncbi:hypothetical protein E2C01_021567 [Portunus trituberculatus]|uniref:Uncharacterized protein n=1 Tax=Portunus trituberculatus TaxID=210409 RepID=A0A5B7E6F5_PORTR|nr:hypothetical protein [Portunus trituberculatus]
MSGPDLPAVIGSRYLFSQQSPRNTLFGQPQHTFSCPPPVIQKGQVMPQPTPFKHPTYID